MSHSLTLRSSRSSSKPFLTPAGLVAIAEAAFTIAIGTVGVTHHVIPPLSAPRTCF